MRGGWLELHCGCGVEGHAAGIADRTPAGDDAGLTANSRYSELSRARRADDCASRYQARPPATNSGGTMETEDCNGGIIKAVIICAAVQAVVIVGIWFAVWGWK